MNENAKKWLVALRSGEYKQGRFDLRVGSNKFCCLGVLCDISGLGEWVKNAYLGCTGTLPTEVCNWAGLIASSPGFHGEGECDAWHRKTRLTALNDEGMGFDEIADVIEKYQDQIFA